MIKRVGQLQIGRLVPERHDKACQIHEGTLLFVAAVGIISQQNAFPLPEQAMHFTLCYCILVFSSSHMRVKRPLLHVLYVIFLLYTCSRGHNIRVPEAIPCCCLFFDPAIRATKMLLLRDHAIIWVQLKVYFPYSLFAR